MSRQDPTYEEYYALVLLQKHLGIEGLKLSDGPDIKCDNQFGIEVTSALPEGYQRLKTILTRSTEGKKADPIPKGYTKHPHFIAHPLRVSRNWAKTDKYEQSTSDGVNLILHAIDKKNEKVDSYNKRNNFKTDRLFILTHLTDDESDLKSIGPYVYQYAKNTFQTLYIAIENANCLMVCTSNGISLYYYEKEQLKYSIMAKELWEGGHVHE